jgi:hypothetical protein
MKKITLLVLVLVLACLLAACGNGSILNSKVASVPEYDTAYFKDGLNANLIKINLIDYRIDGSSIYIKGYVIDTAFSKPDKPTYQITMEILTDLSNVVLERIVDRVQVTPTPSPESTED